MGWDTMEQDANKHGAGGGDYLRLKDGESAVVAFVGEPRVRHVVWIDRKPYDYEEGTHDPSEVRTTVQFDVWDKASGERTFDANIVTAKAIKECRDKYGLTKWMFEIKRKGAGFSDTRYSVLPDNEIDDATRAELAKLGHEAPARTSTPPDAGVDVPEEPPRDDFNPY